ncbi:MAG TPA: DNA polymerase III subunit gamma/tau [Ktedonobacteraceae bacterium]|nr:DNA polymerase III subunit gamma/tau [Ktedonobacteraceae bacterium]
MASQSLYRKWRSQTFNDLVGQEPIVETLKNALKSGNLRHAYLFTGPRGTGKTSTARLLAKTVNCENPRDGEPCNECLQCREITAGNSLNVVEIDAASNRGIDNIRELRERVMVPPASGKFKVYVLDEAHMLTTEAFNALLKTLEEPPPYAIFVLATTDVHKMLPTVISRCQRFDFKRITTRQIVSHLNFVAEEEGVKLERSAAELIARAAAGGMRDALSLLDQAIAYAGNEVALSQVQSMLGVADPRAIVKFISFIADLDGSGVLHLIHELSEAGADLRQVNAQVMEYWRALMLTGAGADAAEILDLTEDEMREVRQLAGRFTLDELTECARIFAQNELMQKNQGTPQLGLELAALACIEEHRNPQTRQAAANAAAQQMARPSATVATPPVQPSQLQPMRPAITPPVATPKVEPPVGTQPPSAPAAPTNATAQQGRPTLTVQQVARAWDNVRKRTKQKSKSGLLAAYLANFSVAGIEGTAEQPVVVIQTEKPNHLKYVRDEQRYKDLEWALQMEFNLPSCQVRLVFADASQAQAMAEPPVYSTGAASTLAPQPSAYREPPSASTGSSLPPVASQATEPLPRVEERVPMLSQNEPPRDLYASPSSAPDARKNVVRENRQSTESVPKESLEQKVRHDPVVQEVIRTFTAKIVDIHPK